jgi:hypothetical protein
METSANLLQRLRDCPDEALWQRLDDLDRPLIRRWLLSRRWLRTISFHRRQRSPRDRQHRPQPVRGTRERSPLVRLADVTSEMSQARYRAHGQHVLQIAS